MENVVIPTCFSQIADGRCFTLKKTDLLRTEDGVVFLGRASFKGDHEGKEADIVAIGETAELLSVVMKVPTLYDIESPEFSNFYKNWEDDKRILIVPGNWITLKVNNVREIRILTSLKVAKERQEVHFFRAQHQDVHFSFIASISSVGEREHYHGCPNMLCRRKKIYEAGENRFRCLKCRKTTTKPILCLYLDLTFKRNEETVVARLFSNEAVKLFETSSVEEIKNMAVEEVDRRLLGKRCATVLKPSVYSPQGAMEQARYTISVIEKLQ